ncbi:MAG: Lrp/AsnC family transcriptional regulator [Deltaproteobacteria bacterium HGW-Deltaproteobacteria-21]|nr:MAG: Lrp/AsnC family transcriptional regulator [Deltaproteobacteria bacterium HGW-Deltaproteobacteria-21]
MDRLDREIVNAIQSDFPITSRPFLDLANKLGSTEDIILSRIRILKERGIIRRIGGNFQSRKLNFTSTLCAAKVPEEKLNAFVETVNRYSGVTHNYLRDHEYNVWFTFIAPDMKSIDLALKEISEATGVADILNLPAARMFKIKVDFEV